MVYILEVQKFYPNGHQLHPEWNGKNEHLGYMNIIFKTKKLACDYYDKHNPHMRPLNAHNTYRSDWDPETYIEYVIREYGGEYLKIQPFVEKNKEENILVTNNEIITKFITEVVEKSDEPKDKIKKTELFYEFKLWYQKQHGFNRKPPKGQELYDFMDNKFGLCKSNSWHSVKIIYSENDYKIFEF
jgi:hypothetical protein